MRADALRYAMLTGVKRVRSQVADAVRPTPFWTPLRAEYRIVPAAGRSGRA